MAIWLFSSTNLENIRSRRQPFDFAVFQIAKTGEIHALGVVKEVMPAIFVRAMGAFPML